MVKTYLNGFVGTAAGLWTWLISSMAELSPVIQFVGMTAGAITAVVSAAIAIRTWRRGRETKQAGKP